MSQESDRKAWLAAMQDVLQEHARLLLTGQTRVLDLIKQARGEILAILAAQPADWQQLHLGRVLEQIDAILSAATGKAAAAAADVLERAWELGQLMVDKPLIAIGAAAELLPLQNVRLLRAMQQFVAGRFADVDAVAHGKIDTALSLTLLGGQTPQEAMRQVADAIGPGSEVRARTIVRTEAGRAFASAHYERLLQSAKLHPQLHKVWRRSGKLNSRDEHDIMDGVAVPVEAHFHVPNRKGGTDAMLHPKDPSAPVGQVVNCGCVLLSWDPRLGPPPGAKPFSARELERNPKKAELDRLAKAKGLRQEPLPGAKDAVIPDAKIRRYSLNHEHPSGGHKARVLQSMLGFTLDTADAFEQALRQGLLKTPAVLQDENERDKLDKHRRYKVMMYVTGPNGKRAIVTTAWKIHNDDPLQIPHLLSAYIDTKINDTIMGKRRKE